MDTSKLFDALKNSVFVSELVKVTSTEDIAKLFSNYSIEISDDELAEIKDMLEMIKRELIEARKVNEQELSEVSGGKSNIARKISKPFYYMGYGPGYVVGKIPIVGYTVYHSVKDAILGFYDVLHNKS